jgi:O-antigen ligase
MNADVVYQKSKDTFVRQGSLRIGLANVLIALYFFSLFAPPIPYVTAQTRWYVLLGFCILVYILNGEPLKAVNSRLYWIFYLLSFLGAVLSLFRVSDLTDALYQVVGMSISFFTLLLLIPTLSSARSRRFILVGLLLASLARTVQVENQVRILGTLESAYYLSGFGNDKNYIAFVLALASTATLFLALNWTPMKQNRKSLVAIMRLALVTASLYLIYMIALTYSRSGLLCAGVGYLSVIGVNIFRKRGALQSFLFIIAVGSLIYFAAPAVLKIAPRWAGYLAMDRFSKRAALLDKSLMVISDNPFLGIGINGTKDAYTTTIYESERGLPHNSYLKSWAEIGMVGFAGYVIWIVFFIQKFRYRFLRLSLIDQLWMIVFIPFFVMLFFLDIEPISKTMLALMTGIFYSDSTAK